MVQLVSCNLLCICQCRPLQVGLLAACDRATIPWQSGTQASVGYARDDLLKVQLSRQARCSTKVCWRQGDSKCRARVEGCLETLQVEGKVQDIHVILSCN